MCPAELWILYRLRPVAMRGFVVSQRLQAIQAAAGRSPKGEQSVSRAPSTVRRAAATVLDSCYVAWEPGSGRRRSDPVDGLRILTSNAPSRTPCGVSRLAPTATDPFRQGMGMELAQS